MNIKILFKRLISYMLVLTIILIGNIESLAYTPGDFNGSGSGDYTGTSDPESVAVIHLYHENQGFRCYIVNEHGVNVTNTVDIVKYLPWDTNALKRQSTENLNSFLDKYFSQTGLWANPGGNEYKNIHYLSGAKTDPYYMWSDNNNIPAKIYKDGRNPNTMPNDTYGGIGTIERNDYSDRKKVNKVDNIKYAANAKMYTTQALTLAINSQIIDIYFKDATDFRFNVLDNNKYPYINQYGEQVYIFGKIPTAVETINGHLVLTGDYMKNLMTYPPDKTRLNNIIIKNIMSLKLPNVDGIGNVKNGGELALAFEFIDPKLKQEYLKENELYNSLDEEDKKNSDSPMYKVMENNNLKLAFEPISWGVPTLISNLPHYVKNRWNYFWTDDAIVYGTPTNVHRYMDWIIDTYLNANEIKVSIPDLDERKTNRYDWYDKHLFGSGWQWGYTQKAYYLEKDVPEYGLTAYPYGGDLNMYEMGYLTSTTNTVGWGVMYFSPSLPEVTFTVTWDQSSYPESSYRPGPAPDKSSISTEGNDYKNQTYPDGKVKDKNFNIVKFYATKGNDGNYIYTENHVRNETLHTIILNDEPGYEVDDYFTSTEYREPSSNTDSYDEYKDELPIGAITGTTAGQIQIPHTSNDNTLYMRLVSVETPDPEPDSYNTIIPLYENEISKQLSLSSVIGTPYLSITNHLPSVPNNYDGSRHKEQYRAEGSNGWKAYYNYHNPSLTNTDSELVAKPAPFEIKYSGLFSGNKLASREKQVAVPQSMNGKFTLWRGMDKPTLASYKPEDSSNKKSELKTLGLPEANTPQSTRGKTNSSTDISGIIQKTFTSQFEVDDSNSKYNIETEHRTRDGYTKSCENHSSGHWKWYSWTSWSHYSSENGTTHSTSLATLLTKVYYYLGKPNTGDKQASDNTGLSFKLNTKTMAGGLEANRDFNGRGTAIQTSQAITLYPYTQMKYNTTQDSTWKNTYTLSHYISTIHNTDFVDLAYSKKATNSLELNSNQWSTHSRSIKAVGKDNALPGGALHNLSTPDSNNTQVALRIFQTVTPDSIQPALQSGYDYYNAGAAQARRDDLVNQVTESLKSLSVVQYITQGITKDIKAIYDDTLLNSDGGQSVYGNTTSTDSKYFFKFAQTKADGGAINIKKSDDITENIYNISSFTDGKVKITKDGAEIMSLSKTEDITKILANAELKELDDKTKFFTNFLLAIDRNVGDDGSGNTWYNEAIDSLELHVYTQVFTLGFAEPYSTRSSVLDPKLIGYQASKSDLYNYEDDTKVRSSVYLTYGRATNQASDGVLATWGEGNVAITLPRLPYLFQSKVFYIPNATVQDLN